VTHKARTASLSHEGRARDCWIVPVFSFSLGERVRELGKQGLLGLLLELITNQGFTGEKSVSAPACFFGKERPRDASGKCSKGAKKKKNNKRKKKVHYLKSILGGGP